MTELCMIFRSLCGKEGYQGVATEFQPKGEIFFRNKTFAGIRNKPEKKHQNLRKKEQTPRKKAQN